MEDQSGGHNAFFLSFAAFMFFHGSDQVKLVNHDLQEDHNLVPPMAFWLMPGLNEATADSWVSYLQALRARMILSWCAFLMFPNRLARTRCGSGSSALVGYFGPHADVISQVGNGVLYGYGALVYAYLGTIGLMRLASFPFLAHTHTHSRTENTVTYTCVMCLRHIYIYIYVTLNII